MASVYVSGSITRTSYSFPLNYQKGANTFALEFRETVCCKVPLAIVLEQWPMTRRRNWKTEASLSRETPAAYSINITSDLAPRIR